MSIKFESVGNAYHRCGQENLSNTKIVYAKRAKMKQGAKKSENLRLGVGMNWIDLVT